MTVTQTDRHRIAAAIGNGEVEIAVSIEISYRNCLRGDTGSKVSWWLKRAVAPPEEERHRVAATVRCNEIQMAVAIEIPDRNPMRVRFRGIGHRCGEGAITIAE